VIKIRTHTSSPSSTALTAMAHRTSSMQRPSTSSPKNNRASFRSSKSRAIGPDTMKSPKKIKSERNEDPLSTERSKVKLTKKTSKRLQPEKNGGVEMSPKKELERKKKEDLQKEDSKRDNSTRKTKKTRSIKSDGELSPKISPRRKKDIKREDSKREKLIKRNSEKLRTEKSESDLSVTDSPRTKKDNKRDKLTKKNSKNKVQSDAELSPKLRKGSINNKEKKAKSRSSDDSLDLSKSLSHENGSFRNLAPSSPGSYTGNDSSRILMNGESDANFSPSIRKDILPSCVPSYPVLALGDDAAFHDCIKDENWDKLKKLLKKFDAKYYKKKQQQAKELKELEQEEEAKAAEEEKADEEDEGGDTKDESPKTPKRSFLPMFSRRSSKSLKEEKSPRNQSDASSGSRASRILPKSLQSGRNLADPTKVVSPLLRVDEMGRTPLHLALLHKAPETTLLDLLAAEKKAAFIIDIAGQLPLHYAVQTWQYDHVLEKVIKAFPHALKTKDYSSRTPIGLAVLLARKRQEKENDEDPDNRFLWIHPTSKKERNWQFQQEKIWSKVNFLLKDLMKRNKSVIPSEHGLILEALEAGANPNTINRFVSTADRYLAADDELAGTAIGLCVERHYSLDTLEYAMENCRERTTMISDAVQKALRNHYRMGCHPHGKEKNPFGKQVIEWAKKQEEDSVVQEEAARPVQIKRKSSKLKKRRSVRFLFGANDDDDDDDDESVIEGDDDEEEDATEKGKEGGRDPWIGMDKPCKEWWEILNHLVFYSAYGQNYKESIKPDARHLLHAALSIAVVPPSLVQLLLLVYPDSLKEVCPLYKALPIHIACTRWRYDIIRSETDSSLDRVLKLMLKSDPEIIFRRHKGRLPIHLALSIGQSWSFIKSFVSADKKCVGMRDPQSRFFPFQMAALPMSSKNLQLLMRSQFTPTEWRFMSAARKKAEYKKVEMDQDVRQIGTIFELLKRHPNALIGKPIYRDSVVTTGKSLRLAGKVAMQYLTFVYGKNSQGGYRIRTENVRMLRDAILRADIPQELDTWWGKMKECIWDECKGDIPKEDEYLLHAALYNPEMPPLVTELLLQLFPSSASKPVPGTTNYPLHIAAATTAYHRHPFEMPYGMDNLHLVLAADKRATKRRSHGRTPLHVCLARGKTWKEIRPLVQVDPSSLTMIDQQTGLVPFQLMASFKITSKENALRYSALIEKQTRDFDMDRLSTKDKALALSKIHKKQDLNQLTCIFELLRRRPSAISRKPSGYATSDSGSLGSSSAISLTSFDSEVGGNAARLGEFLAQNTPTGPESIRGLMSPASGRSSLLPFFKDDGNTPSLVTPGDLSMGRPSLSAYLSDGHDSLDRESMHSLGSRGSNLFGSPAKPEYDDDCVSSIGASMHFTQSIEGTSTPPSTARRLRRGKRPSNLPFNIPDLEH